MSAWQPIETAPKGAEFIGLVREYDNDGSFMEAPQFCSRDEQGFTINTGGFGGQCKILAWTPLPAPPER